MGPSIIVIGGNAAGMTAASRAKRIDPNLRILILEASRFISYSICGVPYYPSGEVAHHEELIAFTPEQLFEKRGLEARTRVKVEEILPGRRSLRCRELDSRREFYQNFDSLVVSTGYVPKRPEIAGAELSGVFTVSRLEHGISLREAVRRPGVGRAAVVGAGYIGVMMAQTLRRCGLEVSLFERGPQVSPHLDAECAEAVQEELRRNGVELHLKTRVRRLIGESGRLESIAAGDLTLGADLAIVDVGVRPNTELARASGIACGVTGAIEVDDRGQTSLPSVWSAGNCAQTRCLISGRPMVSSLGTTAAKQGRVVGENLAGIRTTYPGALETSIEQVFDLSVARTGLTLGQAGQAGFRADSVTVKAADRAAYWRGSAPLRVTLVFEKGSGRLLGGQIAGRQSAAKRIDTLATALAAGMDLSQLSQLELAYAPPLATLWDPINIAANAGLRRLAGR